MPLVVLTQIWCTRTMLLFGISKQTTLDERRVQIYTVKLKLSSQLISDCREVPNQTDVVERERKLTMALTKQAYRSKICWFWRRNVEASKGLDFRKPDKKTDENILTASMTLASWVRRNVCTETANKDGTWLREIYSCCCLINSRQDQAAVA